MKRILVPVDFSTHTKTASHFAASLASRTDAEVILFHAFLNQVFYTDGGMAAGFESGILLTDEMILDFFKQKESALEALGENTRTWLAGIGRPDVKVSTRIESGDPEVQILQAIAAHKPGLIVMGSAGMGKKSLFSGSVARRIMDHAEVPVIAVPELGSVPVIRNVAYMTNFDAADVRAILGFGKLFHGQQVSIHLVHLVQDDPEAGQKMASLAKNPLLAGLENFLHPHVLSSDDLNSSLQAFIKEHDIAMLVFIPHKRNILKNLLYRGITKDDLFKANLPLLAIPAESRH